VHFHQAVLDNNLAEITVAYESGWNRLTEKYYAKTEWPEAEIIAPLVNDGECRAMNTFVTLSYVVLDQIFLILYRELYYRHVYSRLQPNIDDRFHSYENSCELFNYLLSTSSLCITIMSKGLYIVLQIRMVRFHLIYLNSGYGTSSTSLFTNSSPSVCGARK